MGRSCDSWTGLLSAVAGRRLLSGLQARRLSLPPQYQVPVYMIAHAAVDQTFRVYQPLQFALAFGHFNNQVMMRYHEVLSFVHRAAFCSACLVSRRRPNRTAVQFTLSGRAGVSVGKLPERCLIAPCYQAVSAWRDHSFGFLIRAAAQRSIWLKE